MIKGTNLLMRLTNISKSNLNQAQAQAPESRQLKMTPQPSTSKNLESRIPGKNLQIEPDDEFAFIRKVVVTESIEPTQSAGFIRSFINAVKNPDRIHLTESNNFRHQVKGVELTISDLNKKIENLNRLASKWRDKGTNIDFRN